MKLLQVEHAIETSGALLESEDWQGEIITRSTRMLDLLAQDDWSRKPTAACLINGESGTGKELIAGDASGQHAGATDPSSRSTARPFPRT